MKKLFSLLVVSMVALAVAGGAFAADKMLGEFKLKTGDGKEFTHESIKDKKVMMVFAQMACRQCRQEMDDLNAANGTENVIVVLVDVASDRAMDSYTKKGYKMKVVLDPDFNLPSKAGVGATPATIVVDKGAITFNKTGYVKGTVEELLKNL